MNQFLNRTDFKYNDTKLKLLKIAVIVCVVFKIYLILKSIRFVCFHILSDGFMERNSITTIIYPSVKISAPRPEKPLQMPSFWLACPPVALAKEGPESYTAQTPTPIYSRVHYICMDDLKTTLSKHYSAKRNPHLHSDLHLLVDEARTLFKETATKGPGSFAFYLGFFKRLGVQKVRQLMAEVKDSKADEPGKLFWWKVKEYLKK